MEISIDSNSIYNVRNIINPHTHGKGSLKRHIREVSVERFERGVRTMLCGTYMASVDGIRGK